MKRYLALIALLFLVVPALGLVETSYSGTILTGEQYDNGTYSYWNTIDENLANQWWSGSAIGTKHIAYNFTAGGGRVLKEVSFVITDNHDGAGYINNPEYVTIYGGNQTDLGVLSPLVSHTYTNIYHNGDTVTLTIPNTAAYWNYWLRICPFTGGGPACNSNNAAGLREVHWYQDPGVIAPVASFNCVPTSQFPNASVVCTDTSTGTSPDYLWTIDAEALGIKGWQTSTSQNFTWQSSYAGLYSVNLRVNNSAGNDWENKTNYVSISGNATPNNCNLPVLPGYSRTVFECLDSQTSSAVSGCDIQLRDNEAGAWSNATNRQDGLWCIDTLPSHTINGYGQATGYTSTSSLNLHALDLSEGMYYLLMIPGYVPAAPDGKVYLYVTVNDYDNSKMIPSAYVTASWSGGGYTAATTSATGTAILTVKNSTSVYITATKSGYVSVNRVITTTPFGPDSTTIGLHQMTVQPTATATTGPGGTVAPTVNPYGTTLPSGVMPAGYTNNQGQIMLDFLAANGLSLVQLCFLVTILALLGVKLGK